MHSVNAHEGTWAALEAPARRKTAMSDEPTLIPGTESPSEDHRRDSRDRYRRAWLIGGCAIAVTAVGFLLALMVIG